MAAGCATLRGHVARTVPGAHVKDHTMSSLTGKRRFARIDRLPPYVFNITAELKLAARRRGEDIIDMSMGNPDGATPAHIVAKLALEYGVHNLGLLDDLGMLLVAEGEDGVDVLVLRHGVARAVAARPLLHLLA